MNKPTISNQHGGDPGWPAKDPDGGKSGGGRKNAVRRKPLQAKGKGGGRPHNGPSTTGRPSGKGRGNNPPGGGGGGKSGPNWPSTTGNPSGKGRDNNPPKK